MSEKLFQEISNYGIVPVISINNVKDAIPLAKALINGGLPVAEVTFRTDCATEAIRQMIEEFPEMLVGAGTVLTVEQVDMAVEAGSKFIVSPGLNPKIVKYCQSINVPIIPGTSSPSDLELALELGLETVKFFPAEVNGGIKAIKAMSAPYRGLKFMPTGGVNEDNLLEYLADESIIACGGTWMVKGDLIDSGQFDEITNLTRLAVKKMLDIKLDHINVKDNSNDKLLNKILMNDQEASENLDKIRLVDKVVNDLAGELVFSCSNLDRVIYHLEKNGVKFNKELVNENEKDYIYVNDSIAGYAVKIFRK